MDGATYPVEDQAPPESVELPPSPPADPVNPAFPGAPSAPDTTYSVDTTSGDPDPGGDSSLPDSSLPQLEIPRDHEYDQSFGNRYKLIDFVEATNLMIDAVNAWYETWKSAWAVDRRRGEKDTRPWLGVQDQFFVEALARGVQAGGMGLSEHDAKIVATRILWADPRFYRFIVDSAGPYYGAERYDLTSRITFNHAIDRREIWRRVRQGGVLEKFLKALRRAMLVPQTYSEKLLMREVREAHVHKAYLMIGPLTPVSHKSKGVGRPGKRRGRPKNEEYVSDPITGEKVLPERIGFLPGTKLDPLWPYHISQNEAAQQIRDGQNRKCSVFQATLWVADNIGNPEATPAQAPSNGAWNTLVWVNVDPKNRKQFEQQKSMILIKHEEQKDAARRMEDDKRRHMRLVDACLAEAESFRASGMVIGLDPAAEIGKEDVEADSSTTDEEYDGALPIGADVVLEPEEEAESD